MRDRPRLALLAAAALWLALAPAQAEDDGSPHRDTDMCGVCHTDDLELQRSHEETCTLCHDESLHSGSLEHVRLEAARVKRVLAGREEIELPLSDEGRIWCGTCHLFHDPSLGDEWLPAAWLPARTGLPGAVRDGVIRRWDAIAARHDLKEVEASFAEKGTRALRLPIEDGALCRQCHGIDP